MKLKVHDDKKKNTNKHTQNIHRKKLENMYEGESIKEFERKIVLERRNESKIRSLSTIPVVYCIRTKRHTFYSQTAPTRRSRQLRFLFAFLCHLSISDSHHIITGVFSHSSIQNGSKTADYSRTLCNIWHLELGHPMDNNLTVLSTVGYHSCNSLTSFLKTV